MHTYTFLSALEDIKESKLYEKEIKYHTNQLMKCLEKQLDKPVYNTVMNNDQELFMNLLKSNEALVDILNEFTLEEKFGIQQLLKKMLNGEHRELLTYKIENLNH